MDTESKVAYLNHLDSEIKHYRDRNMKVALYYATLVILTFVAYGKGEFPNDALAIYLAIAFYLVMLFFIPVYISKTANKSRVLKSIRLKFIQAEFSSEYVVSVTSSSSVGKEFFSGGINSFLLLACTALTLFSLTFFIFIVQTAN